MHPEALYRTGSNGHNFIAKVDSGDHVIAFQNHYGIGLR